MNTKVNKQILKNDGVLPIDAALYSVIKITRKHDKPDLNKSHNTIDVKRPFSIKFREVMELYKHYHHVKITMLPNVC